MGRRSNNLLADRIAALPQPRNQWPKWVVSGGGVGFLRPAPGSWGTLIPAILLALLLALGVPDPQRSLILLGFAMIASGLLIAYGKWAAAYYREADPGSVILDEYAGFAISAAFVPIPGWLSYQSHGIWGILGLVGGLYALFRIADIAKLPPANWLERLPWGWGILCDDLAAGIQVQLVAQVILRL